MKKYHAVKDLYFQGNEMVVTIDGHLISVLFLPLCKRRLSKREIPTRFLLRVTAFTGR